MKKIDFLDRYLVDNEYRIVIYDKRINIVNYESIEDFSNEKIIVRNNNGKTIINGSNLVISKMQDNELIILGDFNSICV